MSEEATQTTASLEQATAPEAAPEAAPAPTPSKSWSEKLDAVLGENTARAQPAAPEPEAAEEADDPGEEKVSWDEVIQDQPPHVQKLMKQLRGESTRRFQEASELKRQAQADRDALFSSDTYKQLQQMAEGAGEQELNLLDPASVDSFIERKVAERLKSVLQPVRQAHQSSIAQQKYTEFMQENPQLQSDAGLRTEVANELRANKSLSLQHAYYTVLGRRSKAAERTRVARRTAERRAAKAAALTVSAPPSRSSSTPSPDLAGKSGAEIYAALRRLRETAD
jgi:hypothetical protein